MERRAGQHLEAQVAMPTDWEERYRTGDMPWEKGTPHPALIAFLKQFVPAGKSPMCGNTICQDRRFLKRVVTA